MKVAEIMVKDVVSVGENASVSTIASLMVERGFSGVPVVDKNGGLLGIITEGDLIVRTARLHYPTYIQFLDGLIYLQSTKGYELELQKALATTAKDMMTSDVLTVSPDTDINDLATLMFEKRVNPVPVVQDGKVVGITSRSDLIKLMVRKDAAES